MAAQSPESVNPTTCRENCSRVCGILLMRNATTNDGRLAETVRIGVDVLGRIAEQTADLCVEGPAEDGACVNNDILDSGVAAFSDACGMAGELIDLNNAMKQN